jgi:hypothetical protein
MINLEEALQELTSKTYAQIQTETTYKWLGRAAACYETCSEEQEFSKKLVWWTLGEEYLHEAIEHGALVNDDGKLVKEVRDTIHLYQENASHTMGSTPEKAT